MGLFNSHLTKVINTKIKSMRVKKNSKNLDDMIPKEFHSSDQFFY